MMRSSHSVVSFGIASPTSIPFDSIPLLASLRREDREALAPLCRVRDYEKGETIFREGEPAERIYFVITGRTKIIKTAGLRDVILDILGDGEPLGAVAVFERRPFPAGAIAIEATQVLSFPEREFFDLLERRPEMTRHLLAGLTFRLITLNKRLADMTGSVDRRAARLFLTLADRVGIAQPQGVFIPLPLSRQEIADLIGTTIETTIRLMSRWQKDEIVLTEKSGFTIPRVENLRDMAVE